MTFFSEWGWNRAVFAAWLEREASSDEKRELGVVWDGIGTLIGGVSW